MGAWQLLEASQLTLHFQLRHDSHAMGLVRAVSGEVIAQDSAFEDSVLEHVQQVRGRVLSDALSKPYGAFKQHHTVQSLKYRSVGPGEDIVRVRRGMRRKGPRLARRMEKTPTFTLHSLT